MTFTQAAVPEQENTYAVQRSNESRYDAVQRSNESRYDLVSSLNSSGKRVHTQKLFGRPQKAGAS